MNNSTEFTDDSPNNEEGAPAKPHFLATVVTPLEERAEMATIKLPKMCHNSFYGS